MFIQKKFNFLCKIFHLKLIQNINANNIKKEEIHFQQNEAYKKC